MVSIITPTHNRLKELKLLVNDIRRQTYQDFEHMIVSDGYDPDVKEFVDSLDLRFKYYSTYPTLDFGNAQRDLGIKKSIGEFGVLVDDDTEIYPTYLQKIVDSLEMDDNISLVVIPIWHQDQNRILQGSIKLNEIDTLQMGFRMKYVGRFPFTGYATEPQFAEMIMGLNDNVYFVGGDILGNWRRGTKKVNLLVVVVAWKRPELLEKCLFSINKSLFGSNDAFFSNSILSVVDNESSDETKEIIKKYAGYYKFLDKNYGINGAVTSLLNEIKDKVDFDFVMFSDGDMYYLESFGRYIRAFEDFNDIGIVTGHDAPEHPILEERTIGEDKCVVKENIRGCHMLMKREFLEKNMPLRQDSNIDFDWWFMRDAPSNTKKCNLRCLVFPRGCVHLGYKCSTWGNVERIEFEEDKELIKEIMKGGGNMDKMLGKLIRLGDDATVYIVRGRYLRAIPDPETLVSIGRDLSDVVSIDKNKARKYSVGTPIPSVKS